MALSVRLLVNRSTDTKILISVFSLTFLWFFVDAYQMSTIVNVDKTGRCASIIPVAQVQDPQLTDLPLVTGDPSQILSAPAALECKLRQSCLAQRLRDSGVSFTEATFRTSYKRLAPIYDRNATAILLSGSDLRDAINALEELLGKDDAVRFRPP